jgi:hypothetical protein
MYISCSFFLPFLDFKQSQDWKCSSGTESIRSASTLEPKEEMVMLMFTTTTQHFSLEFMGPVQAFNFLFAFFFCFFSQKLFIFMYFNSIFRFMLENNNSSSNNNNNNNTNNDDDDTNVAVDVVVVVGMRKRLISSIFNQSEIYRLN